MKADLIAPRALILYALIGAAIITLVWAISGAVIIWVIGKPQSAGEFGDLFGAINALFSGLAFLGVITAIILQRQELIEQRLEIKQARLAQEQSALALQQSMEDAKIRTRLESLNLVIESYRQLTAKTVKTSTLAEREDHTLALKRLAQYESQLRALVDATIKNNE